MPTLLRLLCVATLAWAVGWGLLVLVANLPRPAPRLIVQAVALPGGTAGDLRTGRSAAAMLDRQAAALVRHRHRR